jgi:hypothetical protein
MPMAIQNFTTRFCLNISSSLFAVSTSFAQTPDTQKCGFVPAGKLRVYYCEKGKGPAVIFLHAGFLDRHQWDQSLASYPKQTV